MSTQEKLFKTLVSKMICNKSPETNGREHRLLDFYNQSEHLYDVFCDAVYALVTTNNINTVSLDDEGHTRLNADGNIGGGRYLLLSNQDVVYGCDDIIVYIDLALSRLQKHLECADHLVMPTLSHGRIRRIKLS